MQTNWPKIQQILSKKLTPWQKKVWIDPLTAMIKEQELFVYAPSSYMADFFRARFSETLKEAVRQVLGADCSIHITKIPDDLAQKQRTDARRSAPVIDNGAAGVTLASKETAAPPAVSSLAAVSPAPSIQRQQPSPRPLPAVQMGLPIAAPVERAERKWRHSFEDFVIGPCNELAYAASRSMCGEALATDVLFLSSAPGLGKTHLMQAVGKQLYEKCNRHSPKVEYLTAEEFASDFYLSLKSQQTDKFKARYRALDLLLLEDVHFFQNKEKMQMELLSTVKALSARGGKVIFTSSFLPGDLSQIDDQLQSRLCAGFVSSIERPDEDTRRRILKQKAAMYQVILPEDVEDVLAHHIRSDIRQIESCLHNLILKARLFNSGITMQMAWDAICAYASHAPILDMEGIIDFICKGFNLSREQLSSSRRKQEYVFARNAAFFLARKHTDLSLEAIGRHFNRKHSTVLKGITNIEREMSRQTPLGKQMANTIHMIERNGNSAKPEKVPAGCSNITTRWQPQQRA